LVATQIVFETHATTEDNERGTATGWLPGRLSPRGRAEAGQLGARRRDDGIHTVFTSDLGRAVETAAIALGSTGIPILSDWRLRECDYGERNGTPVEWFVGRRAEHVDVPYPGGESWGDAVRRVQRFLADLDLRWSGARILLIGHSATRWALDHLLDNKRLHDLVDADFAWQEGWEYVLR
jgi:alpha-ribazole phosphatase/probable phosphoglycerate mutase